MPSEWAYAKASEWYFVSGGRRNEIASLAALLDAARAEGYAAAREQAAGLFEKFIGYSDLYGTKRCEFCGVTVPGGVPSPAAPSGPLDVCEACMVRAELRAMKEAPEEDRGM